MSDTNAVRLSLPWVDDREAASIYADILKELRILRNTGLSFLHQATILVNTHVSTVIASASVPLTAVCRRMLGETSERRVWTNKSSTS